MTWSLASWTDCDSPGPAGPGGQANKGEGDERNHRRSLLPASAPASAGGLGSRRGGGARCTGGGLRRSQPGRVIPVAPAGLSALPRVLAVHALARRTGLSHLQQGPGGSLVHPASPPAGMLTAPGYDAAFRACLKLAVIGGRSRTRYQVAALQALKQAECVRTHGITGFPSPGDPGWRHPLARLHGRRPRLPHPPVPGCGESLRHGTGVAVTPARNWPLGANFRAVNQPLLGPDMVATR